VLPASARARRPFVKCAEPGGGCAPKPGHHRPSVGDLVDAASGGWVQVQAPESDPAGTAAARSGRRTGKGTAWPSPQGPISGSRTVAFSSG